MEREAYKSVIEGLLFISGDEGLELKQIAEVLDLMQNEVLALLEEMRREYQAQNRGLQIIEVAGTYQLATKPEHAPYFEKLASSPTQSTLSQAALETLAIIAYQQPITRSEVEEIRGVKSEKALNTLLSKSLIKEVGRKEGAGRPILYGTTKEFLDYFGLNSLDDLPPLPEQLGEEREIEALFSRR